MINECANKRSKPQHGGRRIHRSHRPLKKAQYSDWFWVLVLSIYSKKKKKKAPSHLDGISNTRTVLRPSDTSFIVLSDSTGNAKIHPIKFVCRINKGKLSFLSGGEERQSLRSPAQSMFTSCSVCIPIVMRIIYFTQRDAKAIRLQLSSQLLICTTEMRSHQVCACEEAFPSSTAPYILTSCSLCIPAGVCNDFPPIGHLYIASTTCSHIHKPCDSSITYPFIHTHTTCQRSPVPPRFILMPVKQYQTHPLRHLHFPQSQHLKRYLSEQTGAVLFSRPFVLSR